MPNYLWKQETPVLFTCIEGGEWLQWTGEPLHEWQLLARDKGSVEIGEELVHSLKFGDGREWDCVNGWRTSARVL